MAVILIVAIIIIIMIAHSHEKERQWWSIEVVLRLHGHYRTPMDSYDRFCYLHEHDLLHVWRDWYRKGIPLEVCHTEKEFLFRNNVSWSLYRGVEPIPARYLSWLK
jgi:hypothetical protein